MRIGGLLAAGPTRSVEFFPPKTEAGMAQLRRTLRELEPAAFSFASVTYGAGGTRKGPTRDVVIEVSRAWDVPVMAHLTCIGHTSTEIGELLDDYEAHGVENILALAGDPPVDGSAPTGDFTYASELVDLLAGRGRFGIAVAAFPEVHPRSAERSQDRVHLARKLESADFAVTQFFFDADHYARLMDELGKLGCTKPVVPGIMPLVNTTTIRRFAAINGTAFPEELAARVDAADSEEDRLAIAVDAAVELCGKLVDLGVPGLHFYCLNRSDATLAILESLG